MPPVPSANRKHLLAREGFMKAVWEKTHEENGWAAPPGSGGRRGKWRWGLSAKIWGLHEEGCRGRWWPGQAPPTCSRSCWELGTSEREQEGSDAEDVSKRYGALRRLKKKLPTWKMKPKSCRSDTRTHEEWSRPGGGWTTRKVTVASSSALPSPYPPRKRGESYSKEVPEMEKDHGGFMDFSPSHQWPEAPPSLPTPSERLLRWCVVSSRINALYSWLQESR